MNRIGENLTRDPVQDRAASVGGDAEEGGGGAAGGARELDGQTTCAHGCGADETINSGQLFGLALQD